MGNITIALFTHCQDSFGSDLQEILKKEYEKISFIYPSTFDTNAAIEKIKSSVASVAIFDTASISKEMAQELISAVKKNSLDTMIFSHSGEPVKGVTHLNNNEKLLSVLKEK